MKSLTALVRFVAAAVPCAGALAQTTTQLTYAPGGGPADHSSWGPAISPDGRFVAFMSYASNLVPGDTNGFTDVFVLDRSTGTTLLASVATGGGQTNDESWEPAISADGRYVAFESLASNLVPGDTNYDLDVFVRDVVAGTTTRASVDANGAEGPDMSMGPSLSADGRFLAFATPNPLVPGDGNVHWDVYVRDLVGGTIVLASIGAGGGSANGGSTFASLSASGARIAFQSDANDLVPNDTNGFSDIFVRDLVAGTTVRASVDSTGLAANHNSGAAALSADGLHVAFASVASNLVPGDANGFIDVFARDLAGGTTVLVSGAQGGAGGDWNSRYPSISADGRHVAFSGESSNLVPGDANGVSDVFVRDLAAGTTTRVSVSTAGAEGNLWSTSSSISADGRLVAFDSDASNLVPGFGSPSSDVFLRDRGPQYPSVYCTAGTSSSGCAPSISGAGVPSASSGSGFTIAAANVEGLKQGLVFYGIDNSGFAPVAWGSTSSWLCVKAPTQRMPLQFSGGTFGACDGSLSIDFNNFLATNPGALGLPFVAGRHVFAQAWYRDPPSSKTTALSDALEFALGP